MALNLIGEFESKRDNKDYKIQNIRVIGYLYKAVDKPVDRLNSKMLGDFTKFGVVRFFMIGLGAGTIYQECVGDVLVALDDDTRMFSYIMFEGTCLYVYGTPYLSVLKFDESKKVVKAIKSTTFDVQDRVKLGLSRKELNILDKYIENPFFNGTPEFLKTQAVGVGVERVIVGDGVLCEIGKSLDTNVPKRLKPTLGMVVKDSMVNGVSNELSFLQMFKYIGREVKVDKSGCSLSDQLNIDKYVRELNIDVVDGVIGDSDVYIREPNEKPITFR